MPHQPTWTPLPTQPHLETALRDPDIAVVAWLAEVRYATAHQAAIWLNATDRQLEHRLPRLEAAGYVQRTPSVYHGRRIQVWTASRHAATLLAADDPHWSAMHPHWQSVADQAVLGRALVHSLARNDICLDLLQNADQLGWPALWHFPTPRWVEPVTHTVVVPDAWMTIAGHPWAVEMERSWRSSTLQRKMAQYAVFYQHRSWGAWTTRLPRVLLVLADASTQDRRLSTWLANLDDLRSEWVAVLPWAEVLGQWRVWTWSATGERRQVAWVDLHRAPPRWAPPSPVVPSVPVRRRLRVRTAPDLPWEDDRDRY